MTDRFSKLDSAQAVNQHTQPLDWRIQLAIELIQAEPYRKWSLADLASKVHLSRSHFRHLFTQEIGEPFKQYVKRLRLQHLDERLKDTAGSIKEVVSEFNIDESHLRRDFKEFSGSSPSAYRRRVRR